MSTEKQSITGNGGTSYTLQQSVSQASDIEVFVNNTRQEPTVAYTASGTTLTMTGAVNASDSFYVIFQGKAIQTAGLPVDAAITASTGTFSGAVNVSGDLTVDTNTLYVDASNNRVGIGTTSPDQPLHIQSSGDAQAIMKTSGATNYSMSIYENSADNIHNWGVGRWHDGRFVISHKNSTGSWSNAGVNERFVIETTQGAVTMPAQPSFMQKEQPSVSASNKIVGGVSDHNNGNHFNAANGTFTAPIAGRYLFTGGVLTNASNARMEIFVRKNGSNHIAGNEVTGSQNYGSPVISVITNLAANDTVDLYLSSGTMYSGHPSNYFSGCLLG